MKRNSSSGMLIIASVFATLLVLPGRNAIASGLSQSAEPEPSRTLVIIVPGMAGNDGFWPNVIAGKVTFASELCRAAGPGTEIYPYLWNGAPDHASREAAARQLATVIDQVAAGFDRICLVGHSFGGDIALRAAGLCQTKIDIAVCIAAPHTYLLMKNPSGQKIYVPVYCTFESRQNIGTIVNLYPENDTAVVNIANQYKQKELTDADAIPLTQSWQEHLGFPRLADDSLEAQLHKTEQDIAIAEPLNAANANIPIQSLVIPGPGFTFAEHSAIHSRRMGYVIGELLREGATKARLEYLATMIQPKDSDQGEPVAEDYQQLWLKTHKQDFDQIGWRLDTATITLEPEASEAAHNLDGLPASPLIRVTTDDATAGVKTLYKSLPAIHAPSATWQTNFILQNLETARLSVAAFHEVGNPTDLGGISLTGTDTEPPTEIDADPMHGLLWSAALDWVPVHY
ncbi:MAG: alpha/beta hydrolase [Tepidisphaeraceae bacterium]|jgi:pimeloyl-ACP methyl ester carboxylesterase